MNLIKPQKLRKGDLVATVSLAWGGAGDEEIRWRYEQGKKRLQEVFGLRVIEMPNTLKGSEFLYQHPELRAKDLMDAFANPEVKGIFTCIGGNDSIRMLPYIDYDLIRKNPKVFLGYSDNTTTHYICLKAGLTSFYGASILAEFAENIKIFDYTEKYIRETLFSANLIGEIPVSTEWTGQRIPWLEENKNTAKTLQPNQGAILLQGEGTVRGHLIGGCVEVLEMLKATELWDKRYFNNGILFLETSEEMPDPAWITYWLRNYAAQGILQKVNGILWSKPYQGKYFEEYQNSILTVLREYHLENLPVLYNLTFGHNEPMMCLPYGVMAEINCTNKSFSILEAGVV